MAFLGDYGPHTCPGRLLSAEDSVDATAIDGGCCAGATGGGAGRWPVMYWTLDYKEGWRKGVFFASSLLEDIKTKS